MHRARNKETGQLIQSIVLEDDSSYADLRNNEWFADPDLIEKVNEQKYPDSAKIPVYYRKSSIRTSKNGNEYFVSPCYCLFKGDSKNVSQKGESELHKLCKDLVFNYIVKKKLDMYYLTVSSEKVSINKDSFDFNRLKIEERLINSISTQVADIIVPFKESHPALGNGIIVEVQLSSQNPEKTEERSFNYSNKGYSVLWLKPADFMCYDEKNPNWIKSFTDLELKKLEHKVESCGELSEKHKEKCREEILYLTQKWSREIDNKMEKFRTVSSELNYRISIHRFIDDVPCPKCGEKRLYFDRFESKAGKLIDSVKCSYGCKYFEFLTKFISERGGPIER